MNVKVEALDQHKVKVTVEVPAADVVKGYKQAVSRFANQIRLKGFRKGKAPRKVLEMYLGKEAIEGEAKEIVFNRALEQALQDEKLVPVTQPEVKDESFSEKDGSTFTATFVKRPEVKLGEYKNLDAKHAEPVVTDDDVMAQLKQLAENNARLEVVEGAELKDGDFAIIDFKGTVNGEAFEGGEGKAYPLEIGSGSFIPGFEDQLVGAELGSDVDVKVTFPAEYQAKELAGKEAIFRCAVKKIEAKELPELDDDFAKDVSEFDTLAEYKENVKKGLVEKKEAEALRAKEDAAIEKVIEGAQMDIPEAMIKSQCSQMLDDFARRMQAQGLSMEQYFQFTGMTAEKMMEDMKPQALKRIQTRLVLEKIAEVENIQPSEDEVNAEIAKMAEAYKMAADKLKELLGDRELEQMKKDMAVQKAVTLVAEAAKEA